MHAHRKRSVLLLSVLLTFASLLTACQTDRPSPQDKVTACTSQERPAVTLLTTPRTSTAPVYFSSGHYLYALDAGNGALRWCVNFTAASAASAGSDVGSLTLSGGGLYANTGDGELVAFDPPSGGLRWEYETHVFPLLNRPFVVNDGIYGGGLSTMYAFNAGDGSIRWQYQTAQAGTEFTLRNASPALADGQLYFSTRGIVQGKNVQNQLIAVDAATGGKSWMKQWTGQFSGIKSSLFVEQDVLMYVQGTTLNANVAGFGGVGSNVLTAVDARNGNLLWQSRKNIDDEMVLADNNSVYGWEPGQGKQLASLSAMNVHNGSVRWSVSLSAGPASMCISYGILYMSNGTDFYALSTQDGHTLWHASSQAGSSNGVIASAPVVQAGEVYFVTAGLNKTGLGFGPPLLHAFNAASGTQDWYASVPQRSLESFGDVAA